MKKILLTAMILMTAAGLFAEPVAQPAFRLLDGYLDKRTYDAEYAAKVAPWFLIGSGAALGATSALVWYCGDEISQSSGHGDMDPNTKLGMTVGFAVGSVVLTGVGVALGLYPPVIDERAPYSAIFQETDPVLQESMAAARLKALSENGHDTRIVSGWVNLGVSGASIALQILTNRDNGQPWSADLLDDTSWSLGSIVAGATSLLVRSPEETLYEEYLFITARSVKN